MAGDCADVNVSRARHTGITYRSGEISDVLRERPGLDKESVEYVGGEDERERGGEVVQHLGESRPSRRVACGGKKGRSPSPGEDKGKRKDVNSESGTGGSLAARCSRARPVHSQLPGLLVTGATRLVTPPARLLTGSGPGSTLGLGNETVTFSFPCRTHHGSSL